MTLFPVLKQQSPPPITQESHGDFVDSQRNALSRFKIRLANGEYTSTKWRPWSTSGLFGVKIGPKFRSIKGVPSL